MSKKAIRKVVFFVESVFTSRDYDRYGVKTFQDYQLNVEVWDFTPLLHGELFFQENDQTTSDFEERKIFRSFRQALDAIATLSSNDYIISVINFNFKTLKLYRAVEKSRVRLGIFSTNAVPPLYIKAGVIETIGNKLKQEITFRRVVNAIFRRMPLKLFGLRPADFIVAGGTKSIDYAKNKYAQLLTPATEPLWAHTMDYDIFLEHERYSTQEKPFGIYLDQYIPFHSDYLRKGEMPDLDIESHFSALRKFFALVEKELKIQIVIAAHPRSNYESLPGYFGAREMIRGKTAELVKNSSLVIAHFSTAINFAIMFNKPILFVATKSLRQTLDFGYIQTMSQILHKQPIIVDEIDELENVEISLDEKVYENYMEAYVKRKATPLNKRLWEIVLERLQ